MKRITDYINKKLSQAHLDADDITGPLTPAVDFSGGICVIIGKPFTNERDEEYIIAKELIKKLGYKNVTMDIEDLYKEMSEVDDAEYFVFATDGKEVSCFIYGDVGVIGIN